MSMRDSATEANQDRLHHIEVLTDPALAHLDTTALLTELLDRVTDILQVDTAAVVLLESPDQLIAVRAS
jgi:hypothetical protein